MEVKFCFSRSELGPQLSLWFAGWRRVSYLPSPSLSCFSSGVGLLLHKGQAGIWKDWKESAGSTCRYPLLFQSHLMFSFFALWKTDIGLYFLIKSNLGPGSKVPKWGSLNCLPLSVTGCNLDGPQQAHVSLSTIEKTPPPPRNQERTFAFFFFPMLGNQTQISFLQGTD